MNIFVDVDSFTSPDVSKRTKEAKDMYERGDYKAVIIFVDSLFGWGEGELDRYEYTQEEAIRCLKVLGGESVIEGV